MIEDTDTWRAAKLLVGWHGNELAVHGAMRADELLADGDIDERSICMRIPGAIEELLRGRGDDPVRRVAVARVLPGGDRMRRAPRSISLASAPRT